MTTCRHVWLATAALLVGTAGATAADLPFRKAAPVEYVRICDAFGAGFFYIPGTDTCLRILGQVRGEVSFRGNAPTNNPTAFAYNKGGTIYPRDLTSFRGRAYLNADARVKTAYGTLRAFVSIRETVDSTSPGPVGGRGILGVAGVPAGVRASTGLFQGLAPGAQSTVDKGFIQFAGLTAGRTNSFFDFDAQSYELLTNTVANSNQVTELLAYTATFGGGFSATISVENATERRIGDDGTVTHSSFNNFALAPIPPVLAGNYNNPILGAGGGRAGVLAYGGERLPDFVASVRYDADWGSAQVAGAYHELRNVPTDVLNAAGTAVAVQNTTASADGFAVIGGVKVLLPTLAKGDSLTLQGTYEQGAMDYVNSVNYTPVGLSNVFNSTTTGLAQSFSVPLNDGFVNSAGKIVMNSAVGAFGAFRHYFIPDVYGSLYGSYLDITNPTQAQRLGAGFDSARIWQIGGNVVWTPVKDFQIGAEALYTNLRYASNANGLFFGNGGAAAPGVAGSVGSGTTPQNPDDYRARLSFRRSF